MIPPKEHPPTSFWKLIGRFLFMLLFGLPLLWIFFGVITGIIYLVLFMVAKCPDMNDLGGTRDIRGWPTIFTHRIYPGILVLFGFAAWATIQYPTTMIQVGGVLLGVVIGILIIWLGKILKSKICPTVTFVNTEVPKHGGLDNC